MHIRLYQRLGTGTGLRRWHRCVVQKQLRFCAVGGRPPGDASRGDASSSSEASITHSSAVPSDITRVRRMPLVLIEEVPVPKPEVDDLELIMTAWTDDQARFYSFVSWGLRFAMLFIASAVVYIFYDSVLSAERALRGTMHVPKDLRIGAVVFLDIAEEGREPGRVVIGLLAEDCPLYCEYFHRRCTASGGTGDSFRGLRLTSMIPGHCAIFGDGRKMEHGLEGFNPHYLPTERLVSGPWRGALSSIAYDHNRESPNFVIHTSSGDYGPQVFGIVLAGFDMIQRMNKAGTSHGSNPKRHFVVENCGELCTLDKTNIVPLPWKLYESISEGYDDQRFGARSDVFASVPAVGPQGPSQLLADGGVVIASGGEAKASKPFWRFW